MLFKLLNVHASIHVFLDVSYVLGTKGKRKAQKLIHTVSLFHILLSGLYVTLIRNTLPAFSFILV
jgi:hypothetical protein